MVNSITETQQELFFDLLSSILEGLHSWVFVQLWLDKLCLGLSVGSFHTQETMHWCWIWASNFGDNLT